MHSLHGVIENNQRGLTAGEHYRHGGVGRILHASALEKDRGKYMVASGRKEEEEIKCGAFLCSVPVGLHTAGAISSSGCSMLNTVGRGSLCK